MTKKTLCDFVDPKQDPKYYLNRYYNEEMCKDWFDKTYPEWTIEQAVGIAKSEPKVEQKIEEVKEKIKDAKPKGDNFFGKFTHKLQEKMKTIEEKPVEKPVKAKVRPKEKEPDFITKEKLKFNTEVYAGVAKDPTAKGGYRYIIQQPRLTKKEGADYQIFKKLLMTELQISLNEVSDRKKAQGILMRKIHLIMEKYKLKIKPDSLKKIMYFMIRDCVYLGKIEPLMRDHMVEEISCDGTNIPLYIWHREYESMPTNIVFKNKTDLDNFAVKISYVCGKHASMSEPIIDASLYDGSRINITLGDEITKHGSTFTIRRFRADPITITDLIKFKTMSPEVGAYLWYVVEKNATMLVAGGTASGKTTALNALASFIQPAQKIVSIEDTQELNLHHENWIPAVSRQNFTDGRIGEINQYDLLRASLRQRPDVIIVGETRGKEAYTLFQAMATGHGGFSSIHANSVEATLTRLNSAPMDIPKPLIANTLDLIYLQLKLKVKGKSVRRVIQVSEIDGYDEKTGEIKTNEIFRWNPHTDKFNKTFKKSVVLNKIKERYGESDEEIKVGLEKRRKVLQMMNKENIRDNVDVAEVIRKFYVEEH